MNGTEVAIETYLIAAAISFLVAGIILLIRNILSVDKRRGEKAKR